MESKSLFNNKDAFYIAERLDAIDNLIPIPPHTIKEFNDPDMYIIWTKLLAPPPSPPPPPANATNLLTFKVSLTPAQIKTLNSIPVLAISTPGIGKAIELMSFDLIMTFVTTSYGGMVIMMQCPTAVNNPQAAGNGIVDAITDVFCRVGLTSGDFGFNLNTFKEDEPLNITTNADVINGDSPIVVYGTYRIITL